MPWYLRKSLSRGPVRLNLSKSGLGASFGVKGLRIGVGPRGTYLAAGRGGLYYRQYLNGGRSGSASSVPSPQLTPVSMQSPEPELNLEFAAVPANDDEVAAEINARLKAIRWSRLLIVAAVMSVFFAFAKGFMIIALLAAAGFVVWAVVQSKREAEARRIEFNYDLSEEDAKKYNQFTKDISAAASSSVIWRVTSQTMNRDAKYHAGASRSLDRTPTRIAFNDARITSNVTTSWIGVVGGSLCLLPDRMLFFGPMGVSSLDYPPVQSSADYVNFRESGYVPPDSTNVGTTWQYVNRDGGPDRRFNNNRQIPIQRYSEFSFQHPKLSFTLEFSRQDGATQLVNAFYSITNKISPAQIAEIKASIRQLRAVASVANVALTMNPSGPSDKLAAALRNLSSELEASDARGTAAFAAARAAKPSNRDGAQLSFGDGLAFCRARLDDLTSAVKAITDTIAGYATAGSQSFASDIADFLERVAAIEKKMNEAALPALWVPARSAFTTMVEAMLGGVQKWPATLSSQADGLGDATSCTIKLSITFDVRIYANALADCAESALKSMT